MAFTLQVKVIFVDSGSACFRGLAEPKPGICVSIYVPPRHLFHGERVGERKFYVQMPEYRKILGVKGRKSAASSSDKPCSIGLSSRQVIFSKSRWNLVQGCEAGGTKELWHRLAVRWSFYGFRQSRILLCGKRNHFKEKELWHHVQGSRNGKGARVNHDDLASLWAWTSQAALGNGGRGHSAMVASLRNLSLPVTGLSFIPRAAVCLSVAFYLLYKSAF